MVYYGFEMDVMEQKCVVNHNIDTIAPVLEQQFKLAETQLMKITSPLLNPD